MSCDLKYNDAYVNENTANDCCYWYGKNAVLTHWGRDKMADIFETTFRNTFLNQNASMLNKISLKFVPNGLINNIPSLAQIMAWYWPGDRPLSEPMVVRLRTHIWVTRPQWVKTYSVYVCKSSKATLLVAMSCTLLVKIPLLRAPPIHDETGSPPTDCELTQPCIANRPQCHSLQLALNILSISLHTDFFRCKSSISTLTVVDTVMHWTLFNTGTEWVTN